MGWRLAVLAVVKPRVTGAKSVSYTHLEFVWGADGRSNAGYGFWQMAYGSDGTARG